MATTIGVPERPACGVPKLVSCLQVADFSRRTEFWHPTGANTPFTPLDQADLQAEPRFLAPLG
jgi:hypothetical protein